MLGYKQKGDKYVLYIYRGKEPNYSKSMIKLILKTKYNFIIKDFNNKYKFIKPISTNFLDSFGYQELYFCNKNDAELYIDSINAILLAIKLSDKMPEGRY